MKNFWCPWVQTMSDVLHEKYLVKELRSEEVCRLVLEGISKCCLMFRCGVLCST